VTYFAAIVSVHQPHPLRAGALRGVDQLRDIVKQQVIVRLQEYCSVAPCAENLSQAVDQFLSFHAGLIDTNNAKAVDAQDDRLLRLCVRARRGRLRNLRLHASGLYGRDRHEDHQQH